MNASEIASGTLALQSLHAGGVRTDGPLLQYEVVSDHALNLHRLAIQNRRREARAHGRIPGSESQHWIARDNLRGNYLPLLINQDLNVHRACRTSLLRHDRVWRLRQTDDL